MGHSSIFARGVHALEECNHGVLSRCPDQSSQFLQARLQLGDLLERGSLVTAELGIGRVVLQVDPLAWCDSQGFEHGSQFLRVGVVTNVAVA